MRSLFQKLREYGIDAVAIVVILGFTGLDLFAFSKYMYTRGSFPLIAISIALLLLLVMNSIQFFFGMYWAKRLDPATKNDDDKSHKANVTFYTLLFFMVLFLIGVAIYRISQYDNWGKGGKLVEWIITFSPLLSTAVSALIGMAREKSELEKIKEKYEAAFDKYLKAKDDFARSSSAAKSDYGSLGEVMSISELDIINKLNLSTIKPKSIDDLEQTIQANEADLKHRNDEIKSFLEKLTDNLNNLESYVISKKKNIFAWRLYYELENILKSQSLYLKFREKLSLLYGAMAERNKFLENPHKDDDYGKKELLMNETEMKEFKETVQNEFGPPRTTSLS